jgi:hypothetical protein
MGTLAPFVRSVHAWPPPRYRGRTKPRTQPRTGEHKTEQHHTTCVLYVLARNVCVLISGSLASKHNQNRAIQRTKPHVHAICA